MFFLKLLLMLIALSPLAFYLLGRWHWFFELGTHYLPYGFLASMILLPSQPWIFLAYLLLLFKLWRNLKRISPKPKTQGHSLFFQNIYYKNSYSEKELATLASMDADILAIIESQEKLSAPVGYPYEYRNSEKGPKGLLIWSKEPLLVEEKNWGEQSALQVELPHMELWIIHPLPCLKPSWAENYRIFFEHLAQALPKNKPFLVLGDFNGSYWDKSLSRLAHATGATWASPWQKTWHAKLPFVFLSIDHALSSGLFVSKKSFSFGQSDHRAVFLNFHD